MTLKNKILIGYGVIFALMGIVVLQAVTNLISLGKASEAILSENYRSILAAGNMVNALERQNNGILLVSLGNTKEGIASFRENEACFLEWLARAKDNITINGESELVGAIEKDYTAYRQLFSSFADIHNRPLHFADYQKNIYPLFSKIREACIRLRDLNEKTMYAASNEAKNVARRTIWSTTSAAAAALIITFIFSLLLAERIVRPVRRFMEAAKKISEGDYTVRVPVKTSDELGRLADEFNRMVVQLCRYHEINIEEIISERNKGEAILASIGDGLVIFDAEIKVTGINPAARQMLGLTLTETSTLQYTDIISDPTVCDLIRNTIKTEAAPEIPDEQRIIAVSDGKRSRQYLFAITVICGRDRKLSGIVLLLKDITRLKEVEQLKSDFVMAASHELRTPLTSLEMSVDLLMEYCAQTALPEKYHSLLETAHEEVLRMKALISDLLDLSKIESGRIEMEFEQVKVSTLFDNVQTVFNSQAAMKEVTLTSDIPDGLPEVRADANKVAWVLTNLISNALRYVNKGGSIKLLAHGIGSYVHISVQDDGPGIPSEYQSGIFQKFVQVKGRESGGSGLGLAICKEIVRAHGGTIWVDSAPGRGSTFTFTLPIAKTGANYGKKYDSGRG
jgi:NtrC-family two-component system sensor histidine kinase KinB